SPLAPQGCRRGRVLCSAYPSARLPRRYFKLATASVFFNTELYCRQSLGSPRFFCPLGCPLSLGQLIDVADLLANSLSAPQICNEITALFGSLSANLAPSQHL